MKTVVTLIIGIFILFSTFVFIYMILITIAGVCKAIRKRKTRLDDIETRLDHQQQWIGALQTELDNISKNTKKI